MKRVTCLFSQKDRELLRKFQIKKEVQIKLWKLEQNEFDEFSYRKKNQRNSQQYTISKHNKKPESGKQNYPYQLCRKSVFTSSVLNSHLLNHAKNKQFSSCQFCRRTFSFSSKERLKYHEIICIQNPKQRDVSWIESQKRFKCTLCNIKMRCNHHLKEHMRTHTKEKPFKCDKCEYAGALASSLRCHFDRRHNPNIMKNFVCSLCPKVFYTRSELYIHIRTHTKEMRSDATCGFCKKQLTGVTGRKMHEIICKLNPKQSDEDWVRQQKKFKCKLCEYSSLYGPNLKRHMMAHTGEKPFKCTLCPMRTTTKIDLYRHLATHTNERPNKCPHPHCEYSSVRKSKVMDHVKRCHSER